MWKRKKTKIRELVLTNFTSFWLSFFRIAEKIPSFLDFQIKKTKEKEKYSDCVKSFIPIIKNRHTQQIPIHLHIYNINTQ